MRYLPDKQTKISASSQTVAADRAQNLPGPALNIWLTVF